VDKGNSIVITHQDDYHKKIFDFISNNNFTTVKSDLTKTFRRELRNKTNKCQLIIHKEQIWKYINLNPSAPTVSGLIKIHKTDSPIRPVVNWQNAPAYKLAKMLSKKFQAYIPLLYTFNVKNSIQLINDLLEIPFNSNLCFVSSDITNINSNAPTDELIEIIDSMCIKHGINDKLRHELVSPAP
jgi:hypothetical protein